MSEVDAYQLLAELYDATREMLDLSESKPPYTGPGFDSEMTEATQRFEAAMLTARQALADHNALDKP